MDGLDLTIGEAGNGLTGFRIKPEAPRKRSRWTRFLPFFVVVIIPTIVVSVYYICFASDQYVSEAQFVVRGTSPSSSGLLSSILQTAGGGSQDDIYAVQDYILSRDALADLVKNDHLTDVFARPEADAWARFPGPFSGHGFDALGGTSFEHLYRYYLKHIDIELDTTTGVTTMDVRTFRADDSQRIAQALVAGAERLVNRMNDRQRENAMHDARGEVALAEKRVEDVASDIAAFRNRESLLDPNRQSTPMLQGIFDLKQMLVRTKIQLAQLVASSPHSPLIAGYQQRAAALQAQIKDASTKVTGGNASLVPKITEYDDLSMQREFADKELSSATSSLEAARINAQRQEIYLDPIVQPNEADYPAYPKKVASISTVFFMFLGIYCILGLIVAGAREHKVI